MGKSRNSPNLYEILRTASGRTGTGGAPAPTDKPGNVATITPPPAPAPSTKIEPVPAPPKVAAPALPDKDSRLETVELPPAHKMVTPLVRTPMPSQTAMLNPMATNTPPGSKYTPPRAVESPKLFAHDPGDRTVTVSYNALLFAGLIVFGIAITSYMIGSRTSRAPVETPAANVNSGTETPLTQKKWTIQLLDLRARPGQEKALANAQTSQLKTELEKLNYKGVEIVTLGSAPELHLALMYGRFADRDSKEAREALNAVKALKVGKDQKEPNFAKSAIFVAAQ